MDTLSLCFTFNAVVVSFRQAGLRELFETGRSRKVQPGWSGHPLKGNREGRHAMAVSGPWRITFRWDGKDAHELHLEQYH
jgi:proteic killer suppression protein